MKPTGYKLKEDEFWIGVRDDNLFLPFTASRTREGAWSNWLEAWMDYPADPKNRKRRARERRRIHRQGGRVVRVKIMPMDKAKAWL